MKTAILHIGMHKAGSSAIQQAFRGYDADGVLYADLGVPNHSKAATLLFGAPGRVENKFSRKQGHTPEEIAELTAQNRAQFATALAADRRVILMSGESFSTLPEEGILALRTLLFQHVDRIRILAYVRPPRAWAASAFQQRVWGGLDYFKPQPPGYRRQFEPYLRLFGRDAVEFVKYDRSRFADGNVVADFAARIGAGPVTGQGQAKNIALPAAAVAVFYLLNQSGNYPLGSTARRYERRWLRNFLGAQLLDSGRFRFADTLMQELHNPEDFAWMEQAAGFSLAEPPQAAQPIAVRNEDDLKTLARAALPGLLQTLRHVPQPNRAAEQAKLTQVLDTLDA